MYTALGQFSKKMAIGSNVRLPKLMAANYLIYISFT
jgi:hypothetical protein